MLFISTQDNIIIIDFTKLFFKHIECYFNLLRSIITNCDFQIMSNFWYKIYEIKIIKHHLLIAYYPQIDS